jgi:hypothetical protein
VAGIEGLRACAQALFFFEALPSEIRLAAGSRIRSGRFARLVSGFPILPREFSLQDSNTPTMEVVDYVGTA